MNKNTVFAVLNEKQSSSRSFFQISSFLFFITLLNFQFSYGQDATQYSFSTSTGTSLTTMTGSTTLITTGQDDVASATTNIGFTFNYCNVDYTQFSVSANGVMRLGGTAVTTTGTNNLNNSAPLIAPCWDDMHTGSNGKVHYLLSGSAPNRILTIEWQYRYWSSGGNYTSTVQAILEETTNVIHFIYGTGVALNSATVGINSTTALFQSINTTGNTVSTASTNTNTAFPASGRRFTWTPPIPTITGLSANACPGSNITITGTNLLGSTASNVKIGGTAVASITSNTATQIVAVIGAGTTGNVTVTTYGGTATSAGTFTVNVPAITGQPIAPATMCANTETSSLTVTATGATTYQWRKNGGNLPEVPPYSNVNTATLNINNPSALENGAVLDVVVSNGTCSVTSTSNVLTVNSVPSVTITPSPANAATGVCYTGTGAITSVSWAATAGATSYDVYFGAGSLPGTAVNVATNSYTTGTLLTNTTYYWKVVAMNSCGIAVGSSTWSFTTSAIPCGYCTPTGNLNCTTFDDYISNVTINTLNNTTLCGSGGYTTYAATGTQTTSVLKGSTYTFSLTAGPSTGTHGAGVWIDFNQNGVFTDAGEYFLVSNSIAANSTTNISITIPAGATAGATKMRVRFTYATTVASTHSCAVGGTYGETEDYTITLVTPLPCVTPTTQPTALSLAPNGTSIAGSFTAAVPAADNYLVVINTTGTTPIPANGTTYTVGSAVTGGTVVDIDTNNTFTATGLSTSTLYYLFVFSYNAACTGGPLYYTTSPLNGSTTTLSAPYCTPTGNLNCSSFDDYISNVTINTLNNTTTCGTGGYTAYAATGTQTTSVLKGSSYNFSLTAGPGTGTHGAGVWIDFNRNSVFTDAGEYFLISNAIAANSTTTISIPIPAGATAGATRMRVRFTYSTTIASTGSCSTSGSLGETEDYTITLVDAAPCTTPTAQPTTLVLTPTANTIDGSFTATAPVSTNYLVVRNTTGITPIPVNTTTYTVGATVGLAGNIAVDIDNNTTFTASGLSASTLYYIYVFSYNSSCTGGPLYYTTVPLSGSATTLAANYCTPSVSAGYDSLTYFTNISFVGSLNDVSNTSTYSSSPRGYQNFTTLASKAVQAQGEGLNLTTQGSNRGFTKAWVDWNRDGDFTDAGETVYNTGAIATYSTRFGFVIPAAQPVGNYRIRIRLSKDDYGALFPDSDAISTFDSCQNVAFYGETEDYLFTVIASCAANIASITNGVTCGPGSATLTATGTAGVTQFKWYDALTGGNLLATTATGSWTTPSISTTTTYYVTAVNGCESLERTAIVANVNPLPTLNFTPAAPVVCGEGSVIALTSAGDTQQAYLINETFSTGLGTFTNSNTVSNGASVDNITAWQGRTSPFVPAQQIWFPAISSGFAANKFVMATSDVNYNVHNALISSTVNSTNYLDLTLSFRIFYSRYYEDGTYLTSEYVTVDVSTNGGGTWTELTRYTSDVGAGTRFETKTFNLNAYINQPNLKIRIRHYAANWCQGIAVDDIQLYGYTPLSTAFSWTSTTPVNAYTDAACLIPYTVLTPVATVYVKPTLAQLENGTFDFTATATLSNGCSASQLITVTNTSKIWQNTASTDWNDPNNWKPVGVPTASTCVIVPDNTIISGSGYNAYAKNLTVKSTGILDIQSDNNLTVTDWVNIDAGGVFNLKNNASLVQINNSANTISGIFNMERISQPMNNVDYTYWGSPVTLASAFSLGALSPASTALYSWIPSIGGASGIWSSAPLTTVMDPAKGYIVRAPDSFPTNPLAKITYTANFIGAPNNGDITTPITYGTMGPGSNNDKWNLISNPYPCAINANTFLNLASNVLTLDGTIYFWTHNSPPAAAYPDPFYGDFAINYTANDYASWNKLGGVGTAAASTGGLTPNGFIAAGSAFFVKSLAVAGNATFNNSMRVTSNNNQFYRTANSTTAATENEDFEKHRIWLNLTNSSGAFSQILVGYAEGATADMDRDFDGERFGGNGVTFYSILPENKLGIQGRPLPFDENDQVLLGFNANISGSLSVRIDHIDGLFENQNIYLEDKLLNVIHDMKSAPYVFNTEIGNFNDRFILRYNESALGTDDFDLNNAVKVVVNEKVVVHSSNQPIKNIVVFDLLGRKIDSYKNVDASQFTLNLLTKTMNVVILKITLANDVIVTQKVIY